MQKKVLILSGIRWNETIQRHHEIANFFASLNYKVYFVEGIVSSKFTIDKFSKKFLRKKRMTNSHPKVQVPNENIKIIKLRYVNPMKGIFYLINKMQVEKIIRKYGREYDIVLNYLPINTTSLIIHKVNYNLLIYDCVRDFGNWGGYPNNIERLEIELIRKSNLILTDSYYLTNKMKKNHALDKTFQILPFIHKDHIKLLERAKPVKIIKNITYFGTVGDHIDVETLNKLARNGYKIHIIGKISTNEVMDDTIIYHGFFSDLELLFNKIVEVSDAIIIPYKGNMEGVIPAKLMQCISTGLPIYVNQFYDSNKLEKYLYVYKNPLSLMDMIRNYDFNEHMAKRNEMLKFVTENTIEKQLEILNKKIIDKNQREFAKSNKA